MKNSEFEENREKLDDSFELKHRESENMFLFTKAVLIVAITASIMAVIQGLAFSINIYLLSGIDAIGMIIILLNIITIIKVFIEQDKSNKLGRREW